MTLFSNYYDDLEATTKEMLQENGNENPTDDEVYDAMQTTAEIEWYEWSEILNECFNNFEKMLAIGKTGRWNEPNGNGYFMFESVEDLIENTGVMSFKFEEKGGHLYFHGSHHDGNVNAEIKGITSDGMDYYDRWNYGPESDKRTEFHVLEQIGKRYSRLPKVK